jgi:ribosomal-protein-alanine N-acetyltransferase
MAWNDEAQPTLRTDRLILRPMKPSEGPRIEELLRDPEIAAGTTGVPYPYPEGEAARWIRSHRHEWRSGTAATFGIVDRASGQLVGAVGLEVQPGNDAAELGCWVGVASWNRGYMTEATRALLAFAFGPMRLNRVYAFNMARNAAPARAMEKLGMALEGIQREALRKDGRYEDVAMRAILRSDWEAQHRDPLR